MGAIKIVTGQHVTINYEPASITQRMLAILLDYLFMGIYALVLFFIFFILLSENVAVKETILFIVFGFLCLPALCYHVFFETLMNGQTPGKLILKIRVTNIDGSTPNFVSYFLRWLLLLIDMQPYGGVGALLIIFTKKHQRLGDLAAGTTVVRINSSVKYNIINVLNDYEENYKQVFPKVDELTEGQIRLITGLLETPNSAQTVEAIEQLALKIKQKLNIETNMHPRQFLTTIVKDFNHIS